MLEFIAKYYQVISVVFGLIAGVGVGVGIAYKIHVVFRNHRKDKEESKKALNSQLVELTHQAALFDQRQEFQSEFMSYQEARYNESQSELREQYKRTAKIEARFSID